MKNLLFVLLLFISHWAIAQKAPDKIQKKDKSVIDALVVEISKNEIQYKKFSSPNGATFSIPTSEVSSIVYSSGYIDVMDADESVAAPVVKNTTMDPKSTTVEPVTKPETGKEGPAEPIATTEPEKKEKKEKKPKKEPETKSNDTREASVSGDESKTTVTKLDGKQETIVLPSSDFTGLDIDKLPKSGLEKDERLPAEYAGEYQWKTSERGGRETAWLFEWDNITLIAKEWMGYGWRVQSNNPKDIKLDGNKLVVKKKVIGYFVKFSRGGQEIRGFQPVVDKKAKKDGKQDLFLIKVS
ncbi:hypothetical protein QNI19_33355 [Cytophagaceae bacterium DM2B3-1]|uniref:Uncharacterized protein n=2 Tax=Xanthocytophaga TaxID=3078918 RepID=A0AAE3U4A4_9BACT|nr:MULTISPECIES: hypothetical protein [Xanthocytophaga]MDJ1466369.1 hypothetical protein [Xanthocytophaga flavus]MDJ1479026.1 hypothetical protein [Xanthocytophaga flavus]MDJ1497876.1 hypothetical protein [Xanthocytophaga flavus]MDJ1500539.1 hypothetical protein [Xanthocytophaga agilis]